VAGQTKDPIGEIPPAGAQAPSIAGAILTQRTAIAALALSGGLIIAQIWLRPLWRDEYWALYFSDPHASASQLLSKIARDVHPPLYFLILHYWRQINDGQVFARLFDVAFLIASAAIAWGLRGADPRRENALFLFLCGSSFWLVFYSAEVRMMSAVFLLCGLSVMIVGRTLASARPAAWAGAFLAVGALAASMHFFATAWIAALGGVTGCALLWRGAWRAFFAWGVASVAAIAPAVIWIALVRPDHNPGAGAALTSIGAGLGQALNQFLRGMVVKTVLANCAVAAATAMGFSALFGRRRDPLAWVLALASGLTVAVVFVIHFAWVPLIKERAFIVIIPALLYLAAAAIVALRPDQTRALKLAKAAPIVALISLPLFSSELFGDTEGINTVRAMFRAAPQCARQSVVAVMRRSDQGWDFSEFFIAESLSGAVPGGDIRILPLDTLIAQHRTAPATSCPVKAVIAGLSHGTPPDLPAMRADLVAAGLDMSQLHELKIARGRAYVWTSASP